MVRGGGVPVTAPTLDVSWAVSRDRKVLLRSPLLPIEVGRAASRNRRVSRSSRAGEAGWQSFAFSTARQIWSSDMRHPMFHRMDDEPEVMGISESVLLFVFLVLAVIAALVGLL